MALNNPNKGFFLLLMTALFCFSYSAFALKSSKQSSKLPIKQENLPAIVQQQLLLQQYQQVLPSLKKLAEQGNSLAQYQLALLYLRGKSVKKSAKQAEHWLQQAAPLNKKASYLLGSLYAQGKSLEKDLDKAETFLALAKKQGDNKAKRLYKALFLTNNTLTSPSQLQAALIKAITTGRLTQVIKLYQQGALLISDKSSSVSALIVALENKQADIALWIIKTLNKQQNQQGYDHKNKAGNSALHLAISNNFNNIASLLITSKANINTVNLKNQTPLILAVKVNNSAISQQLINHGAKLKIKDVQGKAALDYISELDLALVIKTKINPKENKTYTSAVLNKQLQHLKKQATDNNSPYYDWPMLTIAVAQKQSLLINELLALGENPWQENPQLDNAITIAIKNEQSKLAIELLTHSTKALATLPEISQEQLSRLFSVAIKYDHLALLKKLLSLSDIEKLHKLAINESPLWFAIKYKQPQSFLSIARMLSPDNRQDKQNRSYLLFAASLNLTDISEYLIAMGLDSSLVDDKGRSALWYATDFGNTLLIDLLIADKSHIEHPDNLGFTPLMRAVIKNCSVCVTSLLNAGADPQKQTTHGNSALLFAAQGRAEVLAIILNFNHRTNQDEEDFIKQRDSKSFTPLMLAIKSDCTRCVALLLKAGANPKRRNIQGEDSFVLAKSKTYILSMLQNY